MKKFSPYEIVFYNYLLFPPPSLKKQKPSSLHTNKKYHLRQILILHYRLPLHNSTPVYGNTVYFLYNLGIFIQFIDNYLTNLRDEQIIS